MEKYMEARLERLRLEHELEHEKHRAFRVIRQCVHACTEAAPLLSLKPAPVLKTPAGRQRLAHKRPDHVADERNPASLALALYCGIGSSSLRADVKAFDRDHMHL